MLIDDIKMLDDSNNYSLNFCFDDLYFGEYLSNLDKLNSEDELLKCLKEEISKTMDKAKNSSANKLNVKTIFSSLYKNRENQIVIFRSTLFLIAENQIKGGTLQKIVFTMNDENLKNETIEIKEY